MSKTVLVGLIGAGIQLSKTPAMHEQEGQLNGLGYVYRLIDLDVLGLSTDNLEELLLCAERTGFTGLNVTAPAKQAIIPFLDEISPEACAIGAVNTVILKDGRRIGHNTDCSGFGEGFRRGLADVKRDRVVQMGAGGAGAAVARALLLEGVDNLTIFDVDASRAEQLVDNLNKHIPGGRATTGGDLDIALNSADGLVNTTPMGMAKFPGMPVPRRLLRPELWVADVVYFPLETELLQAARELGCQTLGGGAMAVFQAVKAFELFTGITPDADRMSRHFSALI